MDIPLECQNCGNRHTDIKACTIGGVTINMCVSCITKAQSHRGKPNVLVPELVYKKVSSL